MCIDLRMDRQTPYFTVANVRQYLNEDQPMGRLYKSQMKISASERDWRLPSSPIVDKKTPGFRMQIEQCIDLHMDRQTPYCTVANVRQYENED